MATRHGKNGVVKGNGNAVAEVQDFTLNEQIGTADDTAMNDAWETHLVGIGSWEGSISCSWDPTDTNGQEAFVAGASISVALYSEGTGSGAHVDSGTATINKVTKNTKRDGVVSRSFDFKGNGALVHGTV
jgi:hypothetical protein